MFSQSRPLEFCAFLNLSNFTLNTPEPLIDVCCCFKFLQAPFLIWVYAPIVKSRSVCQVLHEQHVPRHMHTWILSKVPCFSSSVTLVFQKNLAPRDKSIWRHIIGPRSADWLYLKNVVHPRNSTWNPKFPRGPPVSGSNVCFARGVITKVIIFSIDLNGILCGSQFE